MHDDRCEITCVDEEKVKRAKEAIVQDEMSGMVKLFKALADQTRMKIAFSLYKEEELCVCDVANVIDSSIATASHHLRLLKNLGLAKMRKEGKLVYYSLDDDHVKDLIRVAYEHHKEMEDVNRNE
ncbi:ArsR/SmtB family transcription factor [Priestia taiwanensis]|uniref:Transcriptional regulator n=1 Tax=Priestia taiwanensis TaxID=1347902 RepID=A0A917ARW5_9BACI|nr:metalloregulator ArsR/SmtB family transcription factor [Priestia taiwanensis]MBM7363946.1 DNA-binding transcriptional ArsR family regulator [Priestia taiwanensis]GGE70400.1 transcriptional regulator [Priestia taiwanensis]